MVALQLISNVKAAVGGTRECYPRFNRINDPSLQKKEVCGSSGRRDGLVTFTCGTQATTLTVSGGYLTLKAPTVDSQVVIQCGGVGNAYYMYFPVGLVRTNFWDECKNQVQV